MSRDRAWCATFSVPRTARSGGAVINVQRVHFMIIRSSKAAGVTLLALGFGAGLVVAQTSTSSSDATRHTTSPVTPSGQDPDRSGNSGAIASPVDPTGRPIDRGSGENPSRINSKSTAPMADNSRPQTDVLGAPAMGFDQQFRQRKAEDLIGKQVRGASGEEIGQIRDLIVDSGNGQIRYIVVSSGGVLGIGGTRRAVPATALNPGRDGHLTLGVERSVWEQAPQFREDELSTLAEENRGREIYQHFNQQWSSSGSAGNERGALLLVSQLDDKKIRSGDRTIGEVEDVLINLQDRTAAVLIEVEDNFLDVDEDDFVVGFNHLNISGTGRDLALTTTLSADDFAGAGTNSAAGRLGRPYVWDDDVERQSTRTSDPSSAAQSHPNSGLARSQEGANYASPDPDRRTPSRGAVGAISGAKATDATLQAQAESVRQTLRSGDLGPAARQVEVKVQGEQLVITGWVNSKEDRERVVQAARRAAGTRVGDELEIRDAAE